VVGSVVTSVYRSRVSDALDTLPPELAEQARRNVGRATGVARGMADSLGAEQADAFLQSVRNAFVAGGHVGLRVSAAVALGVGLLLAWRYPDGELTGPNFGH
jgi:hypothetical protein